MNHTVLRHLLTGLVGLVACLMPWLAHAEPYLAVSQGFKCNACHVNPTGGGLRNSAGAAFSQFGMAANPLPAAVPVWRGSMLDWLRVGGDLRTSATRTEVPTQPAQTERGLEQSRLYADVQLIPDHVGLHLDELMRPGKPQRQEAYVRLTTADQRWYLKAGQFYLPFGWRLQDNTAFVRSVSGVSMATPDKGVELGMESDTWSVQLVSSNGPGNVGPTTGRQLTAQAVWLQPDWRVGLVTAHTKSSAGNRLASGVFGGLRTGPLAWLAEIDLVGDSAFPEGRRRLLGALGEVNWTVRQGHNLKFTTELFDPDRHVSQDHKVRHSLLYELTPIPFLQLRAGYRRNGGIPQNNFDNRRTLFLELHAFM